MLDGYESSLEDSFINLLEQNVSKEWFSMSVKNMLGEDWKELALEILENMERKDLIPTLNKYATN